MRGMVFRDDKDALAQRLADLERDLHEAREGLDRKEEELRRLRERLGGIEQGPRKGRPAVVLGAVAAALVVAGAGAAFTARRAAAPVHVDVPAAPPVPPPPPVPPAPPPPPVVPPPAAPEPPPRPSAELTWKATVRAARGNARGHSYR